MAQRLTEQLWMKGLLARFPKKFMGARVLDIGSANINGTNKPFFSQAGVGEYIGLDVLPYNNVDVVCTAHEYDEPDESFDIVCSTSQLEHDMYWQKTLKKMVRLLKSNGLMFFSCCSNWPEHGTSRHMPDTSLTSQVPGWENYYQNLLPKDIRSCLKLGRVFSDYELEVDPDTKIDLHFWGIKK